MRIAGGRRARVRCGPTVGPLPWSLIGLPVLTIDLFSSWNIATVCCIYHKPKRFDESSDESSDESDDGRAKPAASRKTKKHVHNHAHDHGKGDSSAESSGSGSSEKQPSGGTVTELERPVSPNAYEVQPKRS